MDALAAKSDGLSLIPTSHGGKGSQKEGKREKEKVRKEGKGGRKRGEGGRKERKECEKETDRQRGPVSQKVSFLGFEPRVT